MKQLYTLGFIAFILSIAGCQPGNGLVLPIPSVRMSCHQAQSNQCIPERAGTLMYVGLTTAQVNCATHLRMILGPFYHGFEASGAISATLDKKKEFLQGRVTHWFNNIGMPIENLAKGRYLACAFIDTNHNQRWDSGEPIGEGNFNLDDGGEVTINDWY